jgi:hypoxanthine phosphoribosyltransferase
MAATVQASVTLASNAPVKAAVEAVDEALHASSSYDIHADAGDILFTKEQMQAKVVELGKIIGKEYQGRRPIFMPILKGGFIFAADLIRCLDPCPEHLMVEFCSARSYGARVETSGTVQISFDEQVVKGRHVLMVDDLCDSGLTLLSVCERLMEAGAASVQSVVLLDKRARRKVAYDPDYIGFDCPNHWVAGMGMDTNQLYRSLDYVAVLKPSAIKNALEVQA